MRLRLWPDRQARWRDVFVPSPLDNYSVCELRLRRGLRRLSAFVFVFEAKVSVAVSRPMALCGWDRFGWSDLMSGRSLGHLSDLRGESSAVLSDISLLLREHDWNDREGRDARRIHDRVVYLAREREQRLSALPPASVMSWSVVHDCPWSVITRSHHETTNGAIEVSIHYDWAPLTGGSSGARWHIVCVRTAGTPRQTGGRDPLDGVCCEQAVGDLVDWGWPRAEALSIGRAIAEKALSDWIALEPRRMQAWSDNESEHAGGRPVPTQG
jgi:hypothetical protein